MPFAVVGILQEGFLEAVIVVLDLPLGPEHSRGQCASQPDVVDVHWGVAACDAADDQCRRLRPDSAQIQQIAPGALPVEVH